MKLFVLAAAGAALLCAQVPLQLPIKDLPPETVIARVDGKDLTAGEIRTLLESGDPRMINMAKQNPGLFLGSVSVMRYLAEEGEKAHIADQSPTKQQLQIMHDSIIEGAMANRIREDYAVPEQAIADFYAQNQSRYEQAWIKVIAIGFCPAVAQEGGQTVDDIKRKAQEAFAAAHCTSKRTDGQAHDIAVGLVGRIRGGTDFVKLVAQYSEDKDSKATDGDFGLVTRDNSMPPEIKAAVFALNNGDVSDPIRSGSFFYIVKIKEKTVQPLSNVHEPIVQELKQKHFTDWFDGLQKRFKPEILRPDFFTAAPPPQPGGPAQLVKPE